MNRTQTQAIKELRRARRAAKVDNILPIVEGISIISARTVSSEIFALPRPVENVERGQVEISVQKFRNNLKSSFALRLKLKAAADVIDKLPGRGDMLHIVSSGKFDYWTVIRHIIAMLGRVEYLILATWTTNRPNSEDLVAMLDAGTVGGVCLLIGLYFKTREQDVYAYLFDELTKRGQSLICADNHAKIAVIYTETDAYVIEGSANLTANPRIEQMTISNHRELADFHKAWITNL